MKYTVTTKRHTPQGVHSLTIRWNHKPTPDELAAANIDNYTGRELLPGEAIRARKIGRVLFILNTGPPTWWWPRLKFTRKRLGVQFGWLRAALDISYAPWSTK